MAKKTEKNEKSRFGKVCSILTDILVFPVIIIAFACAIFMSSAKANNKVPSIFGNSIVEVLTNSMEVGESDGYRVGDVLIINQNINLDQIDVGDCIAFYAPKQSGYTDNEGNSLVIFHRVVRIVYVKDNDVNKRYFVCHGDNAGALTFVPAQNVGESTHNAEGNIEAGGGYVVKLVDDDEPATNQDHTLPNSQAQLQYVSDEFVIGELKSRASGLITGLVKFCTSPVGITAMVIIPSAIMIALVVLNMIRETKAAKKEKEDDTLVFAQSMAGVEGSSANVEVSTSANDAKSENVVKEEKNTENKEKVEKTSLKADAKPQKTPTKKETPAKDISASKPEAPVKEKPAKAPATPKTEVSKPAEVKTAPAKAPTAKPTPVKQPVEPNKAAPAPKAPAAPKPTPVKAAPAAPKPAPAKAPIAPKAAPPKKG